MKELPLLQDHDDKSSAFKNCIRNNYRHIRKWAMRTKTNCFRIYDREIHNYPLAIDYYDERFCIHYFSQNREESIPADLFKEEIEKHLYALFLAKPSAIYWRTRKRRERLEQYEKSSSTNAFFIVNEYGYKFWVNLKDYLDTGLFLDHRETRHLVASYATRKRVLNLFAYTGAFTVHAALNGALFTKTVDMSNTYCCWAENNFRLNNISLSQNIIIRDDCLHFLEEATRNKELYDIIIIDPPTLSRSKKMGYMFDIQKDYLNLINKALALLSPEGIIFFSTNSRTFIFDEDLPRCSIREISSKTLPLDFQDPKIHRCWTIKRK